MDDSLTLLVDAPSLYFRALFSTPDSITTPEGKPINAAHGFFRMLARLIADLQPDHLACAADDNWRPQWRVDLVPSYKTFRAAADSAQADAEDVLAHQVPVIYGLLEMCDIAVAGHPDYEAEDVLGTLAEAAPGKAAIFSGDRDLFQMVRDPDIYVLFPVRGVSELAHVDESYIEAKYGIPGDRYKDFAVLRGDPSDGLPGVKGIGEKTAAALIVKHGSLDGVLQAAEAGATSNALAKVRKEIDYVRRAAEAVTIVTDIDLGDVETKHPRNLPRGEIVSAAAHFGVQGPIADLVDALNG